LIKVRVIIKKNILFISPGPTYRPHSELYQSRYKELSKDFRGYIFTTSSTAEIIQIGDFVYKSMNYSNSKIRILKFYFFCIWNAVKGERFDLVTTYDPLSSGIIGLIISCLHRCKFAPEVNGVYTSPSEWLDNAESIETKIKKTLYPIIMHFVFRYADGIILLFKGQIEPFSKIVNGKIIHDFHCFVPIESFHNLREDKEVLFVGFPFKRKGVDILIEAFKKIAPLYPEWKLKILGWLNKDELEKAIDGHQQIYYHKPVPNYEMPEHIGSCSILVLPSRSEAMGRVLVEAMAAEKPRIGSNVDGIPTVIHNGVDGLLFESENVDDLAGKLNRLMNDSELRHRLGKAGKMRAKYEFTKEAYIYNLTNFYNAVLAK
jgi:glycosyltransferase involved in cell wall biosynthesis